MKKNKIGLIIITILLFTLTFYLSYNLELNDLNKNILNILTKEFNNNKEVYRIDFMNIYINSLKNNNHFIINNKEEITLEVDKVAYNTTEPVIYIYSTHSNEEYSYLKNNVYNIVPNVKTASYILESELEKLGINSIVEEENTIDLLNSKKLPYSDSYKISRTLLENKKKEYPSLIYFIDLHRDSVGRNATTVSINGVSYARTMFVLGLENENYLENK